MDITDSRHGWKGSIYAVRQEKDSSGPAVGTLTTVEEDDEGVSEEVPSFVLVISDILLRDAKQKY